MLSVNAKGNTVKQKAHQATGFERDNSSKQFIPKMDDFENLKKRLQTRAQDWRSMIECPKLFIADYFSEARNEIDSAIEQALLNIEKEAKTVVQNDGSKQVRLIILDIKALTF